MKPVYTFDTDGHTVVAGDSAKKKCVNPYNLNKEFTKSVCERLDKDAKAKRHGYSRGHP